MLRGMHRVVARTTRRVSIGLVLTIVPYVGGFINLAAFELIVFSLVFWWLLLFAHTVGRPSDEPARAVTRTGSLQLHRRRACPGAKRARGDRGPWPARCVGAHAHDPPAASVGRPLAAPHHTRSERAPARPRAPRHPARFATARVKRPPRSVRSRR